MLAATWTTAIATAVLAVFAVITAVFAIRAFGKQSEEVKTLQKQAADQEKLTSQQAELLKVQSGQLELQKKQLDDQRVVNVRQTEVFQLQAQELGESLKQRKQEAEERHRAQALFVHLFINRHNTNIGAVVRNDSAWPIYQVTFIWRRALGSAHVICGTGKSRFFPERRSGYPGRPWHKRRPHRLRSRCLLP